MEDTPEIYPWNVLAWSPEREQILYRDWGIFYTQKQKLDIAANYYDKSLELRKDDQKALHYRSKSKRIVANTLSAFEDAKAAALYNPKSAPFSIEYCDTLFELNEFENCKRELHDSKRRFFGVKTSSFVDRLIVVDKTFEDTLGHSLTPFVLHNEPIFDHVVKLLEQSKELDLRPLWKILKDGGKCDVLSILEKEEIPLEPREVKRREQAFNIFNQIYFNRNWIDVKFLKKMRSDPNLLIPQSKFSAPLLKNLTGQTYDVCRKFLKMLQARSPLYTEQMRRCPNKKVYDIHKEAHLYRVQYQTRRDMVSALQKIRKLRSEGMLEKLAAYIESFMGDEVVLKTHRVMPWKYEFMNEVYNTLALAYADTFVIPYGLYNRKHDRILTLLNMRPVKLKDHVPFVFGDHSTFQEPDAPDYVLIAYKRKLARLEKRMRFAKHSIERCYLLHEVALNHLLQHRFDECSSVARKGVEESKKCNSNLWRFLSVMLIAKAMAVQHKMERCREALEEGRLIADCLKSRRLTEYMELCCVLNDDEMIARKLTQSMESMRRRRSGTSTFSVRMSSSLRKSSPSTEYEIGHEEHTIGGYEGTSFE